ncbi:MAG: MBL fold metallo-hydrolase [Gemmatimonadota bacterium]
MKVCVLGSGSGGNATLIESRGVRVLVDAGFSGIELERRLAAIDVAPASLSGIVLTHDHRDHSMGVGIFARRHGLPIFVTEATRVACRALLSGAEELVRFEAGRPFQVAGRLGLRVDPFVTVHDAADPMAVIVACATNGTRVGIATDLGRSTAGIRHALSGCDFLILEANHCKLMLGGSRYPASVKQRIASSHGHLSNEDAAQLALELLHPRLAGILLAHLSRECNRPELARTVVGAALHRAGYRGFLDVAPQDRPTEIIDIEALRLRAGPEQLTLL